MSIKVGDLFSYVGDAEIVDQAGARIDLTGWTITAAGVIGTTPIAFVCELVDGPTQAFTIQSVTTEWPVGVLQFDVQFTSPGGESTTSDVVSLRVTKGYTA